ncbi:alpha/beta hydrolase [Desulfosporosinus nitroreducens]|uniref:Alpha/beta fold hydrolase n=1 Tax=Desulfosporosinus nitroreducens TaxID=2018668 RepID=A0ABT8QL67_9FIRM|nr:alpha/beta fold hydrolase [Desulfosporosinus nitroreducens]MDO0822081.1 alpha/beta fold hydrolase [Desulfosporosinus nitroreducens]
MEPQRRLVEPFYFLGNRVGCLLIHGFSGSPSEMRLMGERLTKFGWSVLGVKLSGHGTSPEEMAKTNWEDWAKDAEVGVRKLRESCDIVIGIGLSMGGLLALHLGTLGIIDGLITMNAPMILADRRTRFVRFVRPFMTYVEKPKSKPVATVAKSKTASSVTEPKAERFVYERIPVDALISLNRGIRQVRSKLHTIKCPALLMQSTRDLTVNPISVEIIRKKIQQVNPGVIYWEKSGHILTLGQERDEVVLKVHEFIQRFVEKKESQQS